MEIMAKPYLVPGESTSALSAGMSVLKKGSKRLKLTFSVKTTMVASNKELEAMLDDDLTKQEVPHTVGTSVRDVGVDFKLTRKGGRPTLRKKGCQG